MAVLPRPMFLVIALLGSGVMQGTCARRQVHTLNELLGEVRRGKNEKLSTGREEGTDQSDMVSSARAELASGIMQHMSTYLAEEVDAKERNALQATATVSALERHGITLEKQLHWFALGFEHEQGLFDYVGSNEHIADVGAAENDKEHNHLTKQAGGQQVGERTEQNATTTKELAEEDESVGNKGPINSPGASKRAGLHWSKLKDAVQKIAEMERFDDVLDNGRRYIWEQNVADKSRIDRQELHEDIASFRKLNAQIAKEELATWLQTHNDSEVWDFMPNSVKKRKGMKGRALPSKYLSVTNPKMYQSWKKNQAHRQTTYMQGLYDKLRGVKNQGLLKEIQSLYKRVLQMHQGVAAVKAHIDRHAHVNWALVLEHQDLSKWQRFNRFTKRYVGAALRNAKALIRRIYNVFKFKMHEQDQKCVEDHKLDEQSSMKEANMKTKEQMAALLATDEKGGSEMQEDKKVKLLQAEMGKAEKVLDKKDVLGGEQEANLIGEVEDLQTAGKHMEIELGTNGKVNETAIVEVQKKVDKVAGTACKAKEWWIVRQLKTLWKGIKAAIKTGQQATLPDLGIRGIGGAASVLGGGLEEVIDFWNKEIGLFGWGSAQAGMNSLTAGIGGYAGVGWKGYKLDWSLEEAYQTALFTTGGFSIPLPIPAPLGFGVSATVAVDADNSAGIPWIPEPHGTNGLVIGWSFSAGLSLPWGIDAGMASYTMFTSECFYDKSLGQFIGMIWLPHCLNCTGFIETAVMDSMRLAIKLASYPIITDIVYSLLAWANHRSRNKYKIPQCRCTKETEENYNKSSFPCNTANAHETGWQTCPDNTYNPNKPDDERCSMRSTRHRDDILRMFNLTAQKLEESALVLDQLILIYDKLLGHLETASSPDPDAPDEGPINPYVFHSAEMKEFWQGMKNLDVGCLRVPRERSIRLAGDGQAIKEDPEYKRGTLLQRSYESLASECKTMQQCKKHMNLVVKTSKEKLADSIIRARDAASVERPFGRCSKDAHCQSAATSAPWYEKKSQKLSKSMLKEISTNRECTCPKHGWGKSLISGAKDWYRKCPTNTGTCACKVGWCFRQSALQGPSCFKDDRTVSMLGVKGLKEGLQDWIRTREFELGSAAKVLMRMSCPECEHNNRFEDLMDA